MVPIYTWSRSNRFPRSGQATRCMAPLLDEWRPVPALKSISAAIVFLSHRSSVSSLPIRELAVGLCV
jgi:hypothetical protein